MANNKDLATFNLGVVVQETGINPDTLRAWERRYELPMPERTEGGHRLYSEHDIETVKWLLERQDEGMRIGQAVDLWQRITNQEGNPLVEYPLKGTRAQAPGVIDTEKASGSEEMFEMVREAWLDAALSFNEERAEQILSEAFARYALEDVWEEVLVKGLEKVGEGWYQGNLTIQQEHFTTSLVIQRLHSLIDAAPPPIRKDVITVACPPGEEHTLAPLLITLFLRRKGYPVIYLGANVPVENLEKSLESTGSRVVILTAQILDTAQTLVLTAEKMVDLGYSVGFGGRVFNLFPALIDRVPGLFLGNKLSEVAEQVQHLLRKDLPIEEEFREPSPEMMHLLENLRDKEYRFLDLMLAQTAKLELTKGEINLINERFINAVKSSLYLGDLGYFQAELSWLENLLEARNLSRQQLVSYLQAAGTVLDDLQLDQAEDLHQALREAADNLLKDE